MVHQQIHCLLSQILDNLKMGSLYDCIGGDFGLTDLAGSFNYLMDDSCTFAF